MPSACNIGPQNVAKRKRWGFALIVFAGTLSGLFIALHASLVVKLLVFPFFFAGFVCMLESEQKVCVLYAYQKTAKVE